jgi:hypothetical protein
MRFPAIPEINKTKNTLRVPTLLHSLAEAHRVLEMLRRGIANKETERKLARLINRLDKISAEVSKFSQAENKQNLAGLPTVNPNI